VKIDWLKNEGWRVWSLDGTLLGVFPHIVLCGVNAELVMTDAGTHGYLVTAGRLDRRGDTLFIRRADDGEG
jgi:hypothetical protein